MQGEGGTRKLWSCMQAEPHLPDAVGAAEAVALAAEEVQVCILQQDAPAYA